MHPSGHGRRRTVIVTTGRDDIAYHHIHGGWQRFAVITTTGRDDDDGQRHAAAISFHLYDSGHPRRGSLCGRGLLRPGRVCYVTGPLSEEFYVIRRRRRR